MLVSVAQFQLFFLVLTRVLAILIHVPVLGGPAVPQQVKLAFGVLVSMLALPWAETLPADAAITPLLPFAFSIGRELLIGTLAGFAAELVFSVFKIAGEVMGMAGGFGSGRTLNPALEMTGSGLDQFFYMLVMLLFLLINGHHSFLLGIQRTFEVLPINGPLPDLMLERLLRMTAQMIASGIQMTLPVLAALLLADLTLALLSKVAPQMHVFFLGLPLKVGLSILALSLALDGLLTISAGLTGNLGERMLQLLGL